MTNKNDIQEKLATVLTQKENQLAWDFLATDFSAVTEEEELNYKIQFLLIFFQKPEVLTFILF